MEDNLRVFRTVVSHRVKITGNKIKFFNESDKEDSSITELTEQEIVKWIFDKYELRDVITEQICGLRAKDTDYELEVKEPLLNKEEQKKIGDIDAVLIPKNNVEQTVIIEFKRIKVSTLKDNSVKANKISTTRKKGFSQIKKLCKFDYHKTYLGIIIEDDSRNVKSPNTILRNSNDISVDSIFDINKDDKLESNAGLFFIKVTQPTGENFKARYNFGLNIDKFATEIKQDWTTTNKIKELLTE